MTRRVSTTPQIFRDAQRYLHSRAEDSTVRKQFESSKKPVRKWLLENGEKDDEGNLRYRFPRVITFDDVAYSGVMLRRQVGASTVDETAARGLLAQKGVNLYQRVFKRVEVMDTEELYVLQQEGLISEAQLRSLLVEPEPKYALWPVTADDELEDE